MTNPSRSAKLENIFVGDGEYDLCLRIGELITLQEKTSTGPYILANRLLDGSWMVQDITETLRLGLIGGGMDPRQAFTIVSTYIKEGYFFQYAPVAGELIFAALMGVPDEVLEEKDDAEADPTMASWETTDSSDGVNSSSPVEPQDSLPEM